MIPVNRLLRVVGACVSGYLTLVSGTKNLENTEETYSCESVLSVVFIPFI